MARQRTKHTTELRRGDRVRRTATSSAVYTIKQLVRNRSDGALTIEAYNRKGDYTALTAMPNTVWYVA